MTRSGGKFSIALIAALLAAGALFWMGLARVDERGAPSTRSGAAKKAIPVEVAPVGHGPMTLKRTFSGALEARAKFVVAPKVSGRVERLYVNLADRVQRGQLVAELDNDEYVQAVAQARANLSVARASSDGARSALEIANRELERLRKLQQRGMISDAQLDTASASQVDRQSQLAVARALVNKAESELRSAEIRLGYTKVTAEWSGGRDQRFVAERFVDEGETVAANGQLLRIVELDPIVAVVYVAERDYARLTPGQPAVLTTDAFPARRFDARIVRIAPVFREASRQARVELAVPNQATLLKPGMFARATIVLDHIADATYVPEQALTTREGQEGVFVVGSDKKSATWRKVEVGIREGGRAQITGQDVVGQVVVLGQQQLTGDGAAITLSARDDTVPAGGTVVVPQ
jgi:RND family efflux transporter MFP subunit